MAEPAPSRVDRLLHAPLLRSHRALPAIAIALALVLALPSLKLGFLADDYFHLLFLEGRYPMAGSRLDLYHFAPDGPDAVRELMARGSLPWWTDPGIKLHFLRPLSSALRSVDHDLFGRAPLGYHLHSVAWLIGLVAAAGLVFRRALPGATGALALLLFAVDDCHGMAAYWVACRHMLVAAVPALLGLAAHMRYREEGYRAGRWLALAGVAIGLLGGETALGVVAYALAYDALGPRPLGEPGLRARLVGMWPLLALLGVYLAAYKAGGFGAAESDGYLEPLSDPAGFALGLFVRIPILLGDLIGGVVADLSTPFPRAIFVALGLVATAALALLYRAALPAIPEAERRALRWLVPGTLLAMATSAGGMLGTRLLLVPSLGGAACIAVILRFGLRRVAPTSPEPGVLRRVGWRAVFVVHAVIAPLFSLATALNLGALQAKVEDIARAAELDERRSQRVVIVAVSDPFVAIYTGGVCVAEHPERVAGWQVLSLSKQTHRLTRTGVSSFRLEPVSGRMVQALWERLYRTSRSPFRVGDEMKIEHAKVSVVAVEEGAPKAIELRFESPLDDPGLSFMAWQGGRLRRLTLPAEGESIDLAWEPGPSGVL